MKQAFFRTPYNSANDGRGALRASCLIARVAEGIPPDWLNRFSVKLENDAEKYWLYRISRIPAQYISYLVALSGFGFLSNNGLCTHRVVNY